MAIIEKGTRVQAKGGYRKLGIGTVIEIIHEGSFLEDCTVKMDRGNVLHFRPQQLEKEK